MGGWRIDGGFLRIARREIHLGKPPPPTKKSSKIRFGGVIGIFGGEKPPRISKLTMGQREVERKRFEKHARMVVSTVEVFPTLEMGQKAKLLRERERYNFPTAYVMSSKRNHEIVAAARNSQF